MVAYRILKHALMITGFVFVMMLIVDFLDMFSKKSLTRMMKGGTWRQYSVASFLGATPGCLGAFMDLSLCERPDLLWGSHRSDDCYLRGRDICDAR